MQWNLEELHNWDDLRPYVDCALLPQYLYKNELAIQEHVLRMTYLMNLAIAVEQKLKGRILLFPLSYQVEAKEERERLLLPDGFSFYFVLRYTGHDWGTPVVSSNAYVQYLTVGDHDLDSEIRFEITVDVLYQEILQSWK